MKAYIRTIKRKMRTFFRLSELEDIKQRRADARRRSDTGDVPGKGGNGKK